MNRQNHKTKGAVMSDFLEFLQRNGKTSSIPTTRDMLEQTNDTHFTPSAFETLRLPTDGQTFVTFKDMAIQTAYIVDTLEKRLTESPTLGGRVYARKNELGARYGVSPRTITDWLNTLEAEGVIHPIQGAPSNGAEGDTLYKIAEVEAALRERRKAYNERKNRGSKTTGK